MEDLRDEKTKKKEDGIKNTPFDAWTSVNAVLLKIYMRAGFIIKSYKWIWITILTVLILIYPSQLGGFIGEWLNNFIDSLLNNLK